MNKAKLSLKAVSALVIGNVLEWYDFVVYSLMTVYILQLFFPSHQRANSLLAATATFGVAFLMRPLGAFIFGIYADRVGRRPAMMAIMTCMFTAMLLLACAPTYAQAGMIAPMLIVIARLLQGFSAGGEFGTATAMLVELSPPAQRGFYASWQMVGQNGSALLGSLMGIALTHFLSAEQITTWGWRVPFLAGLLIAPVGIYLRWHIAELPAQTQKSVTRVGIMQSLKQHRKQLMIGMGLGVGGTVATYIKIYMPTFVYHYLHLSMTTSFLGLLAGVVPIIICVPLFGWLSDKIGKRSILIISISLYLLSIEPLFAWLIYSPTITTYIYTEIIFGLLLGAYFGVYAGALSELFPAAIRATGVSLSSNVVVMVFGGFTQFFVTWLITLTGNLFAITYYLLFAVIISLIAAYFYPNNVMFETLESVPALGTAIDYR